MSWAASCPDAPATCLPHLQHIVLTNYSDLLCAATSSYLRTSMGVALESEVV